MPQRIRRTPSLRLAQMPSRDVSNEIARINRNLFLKRVGRPQALDLIVNATLVLAAVLTIVFVIDMAARVTMGD